MNGKVRKPWLWVPTLSFYDAILYITLTLLCLIFYKRTGLSHTEITCLGSLILLPWIIRPVVAESNFLRKYPRPLLLFSVKSFKEMFSFSGNLVLNSLLDKIYNEGTSMVIGRFYTPKMLGYYSKGMSTAQLPSISLYTAILSPLLPSTLTVSCSPLDSVTDEIPPSVLGTTTL